MRANYLVTVNLKDFPAESAEKCNATVVGPSAFLTRLANSAPVFVAQIRDTLD